MTRSVDRQTVSESRSSQAYNPKSTHIFGVLPRALGGPRRLHAVLTERFQLLLQRGQLSLTGSQLGSRRVQMA